MGIGIRSKAQYEYYGGDTRLRFCFSTIPLDGKDYKIGRVGYAVGRAEFYFEIQLLILTAKVILE